MAPILESPRKKRAPILQVATDEPLKDSMMSLPSRKHSMDMANWGDADTSPVSTILASLTRGLLEEMDCPLECPIRQASLNDIDDAFVTVPL